MSHESPFMMFKIECPICKTVNEYESIRVGAYVENGRDTDFCPLDIVWRHPKYQGYNPLTFFAASCGNCYYTRELTNGYKEWKSDTHFRTYRLKTVKERHLDQLAVSGSVIRMMGERIDQQGYPNESAILRILLAVYDELLADHPVKLDLGRFYLRIAWVFRGLATSGSGSNASVISALAELDRAFAQSGAAVKDASMALGTLQRHLVAHSSSSAIPSDARARILPLKEAIETECSSVEEYLSQAEAVLLRVEGAMQEYRRVTLGTPAGSPASSFGKYHSISEFLLSIKEQWPSVVASEDEALRQAVLWYKGAYVDARDIAPGNQQIQAAYLIAELSRRIGDHESARDYFNTTIKAGQEFIYRNRQDQSRTALARKILELAVEQGRLNLETAKA